MWALLGIESGFNPIGFLGIPTRSMAERLERFRFLCRLKLGYYSESTKTRSVTTCDIRKVAVWQVGVFVTDLVDAKFLVRPISALPVRTRATMSAKKYTFQVHMYPRERKKAREGTNRLHANLHWRSRYA
eukprot:2587244-Amphidinium_carterae.2